MEEKRAVIEPGRTPPERDDEKSAADLESHPAKRLADEVTESTRKSADN